MEVLAPTTAVFSYNVNDYLNNHAHRDATQSDIVVSYYPMPTVEDTYKRAATRVAKLTETVITTAVGGNIGLMVKAVKYAYLGKELYKLILDSDIFKHIEPIIDTLTKQGLTSKIDQKKIPIYLYYLACSHQLDYKINPTREVYGSNPTGIENTCDVDLINYCGKFLECANWLYAAKLPKPHDNNVAMCAWYLTKLVRRNRWCVLCCNNTTTKLPNGKLCPGFALLARNVGGKKEAVLSVRGSMSTKDWGINLNEAAIKYTYTTGDKSHGYTDVDGYVHEGMFLGAKTILLDFKIRQYILDLCTNGFDVKIVGHSLGAGTAVLIGAELKNYFSRIDLDSNPQSSPPTVSVIGFATPPIVCGTICDAMIRDNLVVSTVLDDDLIPRLSQSNVVQLIAEVEVIIPVAEKWFNQDSADAKLYANSIGKAPSPQSAIVQKPSHEQLTSIDESIRTTKSLEELNNSEKVEESESGSAERISSSASGTGTKEIIRLVTPGKIVHLHYSEDQGSYVASVINYDFVSLRKIRLLPTAIENHKLESYWHAFRSIKYDMSIESILAERRNRVAKLRYQSIQKQAISRAEIVSSLSVAPTTTPKAVIGTNVVEKTEAVTVDDARVTVTASVSETNPWKSCSICELDCTWPYMLHSDANRGQVTHICRACGNVVCVICAQAEDSILGDGVAEQVTLKNMKLALPALGILQPVRICVHCYLDSFTSM